MERQIDNATTNDRRHLYGSLNLFVMQTNTRPQLQHSIGERHRTRTQTLKNSVVHVVVMRDHRGTQDMSNSSSRRHSSKYEKEMDHAFTLIFHNIKRLQDGVLSNSDPSLARRYSHEELERKSDVSHKPPVRKRSRSEDFLGRPFERLQREDASRSLLQRSNSGSEFHKSASQERKVRFADDYAPSARRSPQISPSAMNESFFHHYDSHYERSSSASQSHRLQEKKLNISNEGKICEPENPTVEKNEVELFNGTEV